MCSHLTSQDMLSTNVSSTCRPLQCRVRLLCVRQNQLQRRTVRSISTQARRKDYSYEAPDTQIASDYNSAQSASDYATQASGVQDQQQYTQTQGVPQYPEPPPRYRSSSSGGFPSFVWVFVGILIATVVSKVWGVIRHPGGIQGWMMAQATKAMMKNMGQPGQPGQASPFPQGFPGMPPNMPGMPPNMGQGWPPAVDTTATSGQQAQASSSQNVSKGQRFQQYKAQEQAKQSSAADRTSRPPQAAPMSSSGPSSSPFVSPPKQAASFTDVNDEDDSDTNASASSSGDPSTSGSTSGNSGPQMPGGFGGFNPQGGQQQQQQYQQQQAGGNNGGTPGGSTGAGKQMLNMMESMMKDPNMQQTLYPYLPEGMRNPQTFEWMLSNPEYRAQLEQMLESQGGALNPQMLQSMQGGGMDMDAYRQHLDQFGVTPDEVMKKILSDPELAQAFNKPEVQAAIMEITNNPGAIIKHSSNPEVMHVITKMSELFPQGPPQGSPQNSPQQ